MIPPIGKAARTESYYLWLTLTVVKQSYFPAGLERARVECFLDQVKRLLQGVRCRFPSYRAYVSVIPEGGISLPFVQYRPGGLRRYAQRPVQAYSPSEPDAVCKIHRARLDHFCFKSALVRPISTPRRMAWARVKSWLRSTIQVSVASSSASCHRMPICSPRPVVGGRPRRFFGVPLIDFAFVAVLSRPACG
jgi:hypothetical protein